MVVRTISKRQQALLAHVRTHGRGLVDQLADQFNVTPQTIRRDLNTLSSLRLLYRVHGGAVSPGSPSDSEQLVNLDYATRRILGFEGKRKIGRRVAALIPNDASIFINIGTTTEQVAEHLTDHVGLQAITNNINIANTLRLSSAIRVITAGGHVRHEDGGIVGDATEEFVDQFKVDFAVIGCSAIEEDGTILDFDIREVKVTNAMVRNARSVILVADNSKFQRKASVRLGNVSQLNYFVSDISPPPKFSKVCQEFGVKVLSVASSAGARQ